MKTRINKLLGEDVIRAGDIFVGQGYIEPAIKERIGRKINQYLSGDTIVSGLPKGYYHINRWIEYSYAKPKREDADANGYILILFPDRSSLRVQWDRTDLAEVYGKDPTHWMPLDFPVEVESHITVDGRTITPLKNGDAKISCGTVIPAVELDKFFEIRKRVTNGK